MAYDRERRSFHPLSGVLHIQNKIGRCRKRSTLRLYMVMLVVLERLTSCCGAIETGKMDIRRVCSRYIEVKSNFGHIDLSHASQQQLMHFHDESLTRPFILILFNFQFHWMIIGLKDAIRFDRLPLLQQVVMISPAPFVIRLLRLLGTEWRRSNCTLPNLLPNIGVKLVHRESQMPWRK